LSAPPGIARTEEPTPAAKPEGGSHLPRITRKDRDAAVRVLLDLGYAVSGGQAWALIRDYRQWQGRDARAFVAGEFRTYVQRRGDLMDVRGKARHPWRVAS
jgi:hypothetical protein